MSELTQVQAMVLSALIEAPVAWVLVRWRHWPGRGAMHAAIASAVATALTHPQLWAFAPALLARLGYVPGALVAETVVVVVEALVVAWGSGLSPLRALALSTLANAASAAAGRVLLG